MVKIRLQRTGAPHKPSFRIVAIDSKKRRDGKVLEILGSCNFRNKTNDFVNIESAKKWLSHGAQPTETAKNVLKRLGCI